MINGKKTMTAGGLCALFGIAGYFLNLHDFSYMMEKLIEALTIIGAAHKFEKITREVKIKNCNDRIKRDKEENELGIEDLIELHLSGGMRQ